MKPSLRAKLIAPFVAALILVPGLLAPSPAAAAVDVYITEGTHHVNGRTWYTDCEPYSSSVTRCRTDIDATQVTYASGRFIVKQGRVFNNLTYLASPRAQWVDNNLGKNGQWVSSEGREWVTECDSPTTGFNGCRSYIWSTYITRTQTATGWQYWQNEGWVFNNMVRFNTSLYARYTGTGERTITLPKGATTLYVQGTHQGEGEFSVAGLDAAGSYTDFPIYDYGQVQVSGAVGIYDDDTVALEVGADGPWTLTISPLTVAPKLAASGTAAGHGSAVYWYYGDPRDVTITHAGEFDFYVSQVTSEDTFELVDWTTGNYTGSAHLAKGPSIVEIVADGSWTIS